MPIENCSKCQKIFQRTLHPLCPTCHQQSMGKLSEVYQFIQSNPQQTIEKVAAGCNLPVKELESMLYAGKLGDAAGKIMSHCQSCAKTIPVMGQKGRFCMDCATKLENKPEKETVEKAATAAPLNKRGVSGKPEKDNARPENEEVTGESAVSVAPVKVEAPPQPNAHAYGFIKRASKF